MNKNKLRYVSILFTLCVAILVLVSMITLLSPRYCCGSTVQRNGGEWKHKRMHARTRSIWTPGHVTGRALKTLRQKNELITGRALDDASFLLNACTCASVLETALSFSSVPLCSLGGWELPSKQSQVAAIITSSSFFSFKRGDALFAILVDCLSNLSFCCKWVNQWVKNSSLSLSPLYVYISVQRGAMGGPFPV